MYRVFKGDVHLNRGHRQGGHQPGGAEGHLVEVDDEVGGVTGQEAVHPAAGAHQADLRVQDTGGEGPRQHAAGVDQTDPSTAVNHLQRDPQHQLEGEVEGEVPPGVVDETVAEEPPELSLPVRTVDQERVQPDVLPAGVSPLGPADPGGEVAGEGELEDGDGGEAPGWGPAPVDVAVILPVTAALLVRITFL